MKGIKVYFETINQMMKERGMDLIGIDISVPSYKVKYSEYVRSITFIYPDGVGVSANDRLY